MSLKIKFILKNEIEFNQNFMNLSLEKLTNHLVYTSTIRITTFATFAWTLEKIGNIQINNGYLKTEIH